MNSLMQLGEIELRYKTPYPSEEYRKINSPEEAYYEARSWIPENTIELRETLIALMLNQQNQVIGVYKLSEGGISQTTLDMGLLVRASTALPTKGVILCHNHPSGNLKPSQSDIKLTNKVKDGLKLVDINLMDHLIVTKNGYTSIMEEIGI